MNLLLQHLAETQTISDSQWGFHSGKSTVKALLETTHNCLNVLEKGKEVGAVFFDFRRPIRLSSPPSTVGKAG